jgi:hypothetical protein
MKFGAPLIQTVVCTSYPCGGDHPCEEERMLMTVVSTMLLEGAAVCHSKLTLLASSSSGGRPTLRRILYGMLRLQVVQAAECCSEGQSSPQIDVCPGRIPALAEDVRDVGIVSAPCVWWSFSAVTWYMTAGCPPNPLEANNLLPQISLHQLLFTDFPPWKKKRKKRKKKNNTVGACRCESIEIVAFVIRCPRGRERRNEDQQCIPRRLKTSRCHCVASCRVVQGLRSA